MATDQPESPILSRLFSELADVRDEIKAVRESVIRMETHGYGVQIEELRRDSRETREKVLVIETKGKMAAIVISAGISVATMVVGGIILYALNVPVHIG